jgi:protein Tex
LIILAETNNILIARELKISVQQVRSVELLLDEGATIPFIARYRKERTGSLDEVAIAGIRDRLAQMAALDSRREAILKSLEERGLLTDELRVAVEAADTMTILEDIYLPYRPKRRTRATIAREKGLEPLACLLFTQDSCIDPQKEAIVYVDHEKNVESVEEALAGARDIIAEWVNEDAETRQTMRGLFEREGILQSRLVKGKERDGIKYSDYFDWQEPLAKIPGHRVLAMFRGEREGLLGLVIRPSEEKALALLHRRFIKNDSAASAQVVEALADSYDRLLAPSIETDVRHKIKERADDEALKVFARNIREHLMSPPLGQKTVLAIDPGYRTGCKVVCLDRQGGLLHNATIHLEQSGAGTENAAKVIRSLIERYAIEAVAIGNGTAGRETETFVRQLGLPENIPVVTVSESGASVYSASPVAREEFPDLDVTIRGAISIGRRLMDPMAELVKIDPKSIGVGQYQHDVDQGRLKASLDDAVMICVNEVGVEINTASKQLLSYVSGIGPALAKNIIDYRSNNGPFRSRDQIKKVPRLGPKAFEMAAGFLRIHDAENPLDASAVHPESYGLVQRMAKDLGCTSVSGLIRHEDLLRQIDFERYTGGSVGLPTVIDIMAELKKPGRDPRERFEIFAFAPGVVKMEQLTPGMRLPGIITNVTNFGAFVDIGVHQDGLVHISQISDNFVKNPADIVKVNQRVTVTVLNIDIERKRIALSMKQSPEEAAPAL